MTTPGKTLEEHLFGPGPKRILALDGGGVRGVVAIAFLERIEAILRERAGGHAAFRLCDHFDLIGGTSTGAIIASALALGYSAAEVRDMYQDLAPKVFRRKPWRVSGWQAKFDAKPLLAAIGVKVGDRTLDSPDLRTGLAIVTKRVDTGSPWVLTNNPRSKYWQAGPDDSYLGNASYSLLQVVRASTAAPYFFAPQAIQIVEGEAPGLFIDGAVSPHNNPSLQLLMLASIKAYGFSWRLGSDNLSMISIGTGTFRQGLDTRRGSRMSAVSLAINALLGLSKDTQSLVLMIMQWLSESPQPWTINSEIGDLAGEFLGGLPFLKFQRYDLTLEATGLADLNGQTVTAKHLRRLRSLDDAAMMKDLYTFATKAAAKQIDASLT